MGYVRIALVVLLYTSTRGVFAESQPPFSVVAFGDSITSATNMDYLVGSQKDCSWSTGDKKATVNSHLCRLRDSLYRKVEG